MSEPKPPSASAEPPVKREKFLGHDSRKLGNWLHDWPLLQMLVLDRRFRWALTGLFLFFVAVSLGLPRIWRVSPQGMNPVIRISALDMLQARLNARRAAKADAQGQHEAAELNWQFAVANNPAAPLLFRGTLSNLLAQPPRHAERFTRAMQSTFWLLRLTQTNQADLNLAVRIFEHFDADALLVEVVRTAPGAPVPFQQNAALKAILRLGYGSRYTEDRARLAATLPASLPPEDVELALHHAAWQAGWGDSRAATQGRAALVAAEAKSELKRLSLRLQLLVHAARQEVEGYAVVLGRLSDLQADDPGYHAVYWRLLQARGRTNEAVSEARAFSQDPTTPGELAGQAQALQALGLDTEVVELLARCAPELGDTPRVWLTWTRSLISLRRWHDLRDLAVQIRQDRRVGSLLSGYSWYIEGIAQHELSNSLDAAAAFASVPQYPIHDDSLVVPAATRMAELGSPAPARDLLLLREAALGQRPEYWGLLLRLAWLVRDPELLLRAAERQCALQPDSLAAQNDLAAALLVNNSDNDRALELTSNLVRQMPASLIVRVNHACALIRSGQTAAAQPLLLSVDADQLNDVSRSVLQFVLAELYSGMGQPDETVAAVGRVNTRLLLPPQLTRLRELPELATATAGSRR